MKVHRKHQVKLVKMLANAHDVDIDGFFGQTYVQS
jgi:hypothetical protein